MRLTDKNDYCFMACVEGQKDVEKIRENCPMYKNCYERQMFQKLKDYEDAEEQGLLLRLPCKVGDTIYLVDFEEEDYDEATVWSIEIDTRENRILINSDYEVGTYAFDSYVCYSKEEAERKLAEQNTVTEDTLNNARD